MRVALPRGQLRGGVCHAGQHLPGLSSILGMAVPPARVSSAAIVWGPGSTPLERPGALVGGRESYGSMFSRFGNLVYDAKGAWSRRGLGRFQWSESAQIPLIWYL